MCAVGTATANEDKRGGGGDGGRSSTGRKEVAKSRDLRRAHSSATTATTASRASVTLGTEAAAKLEGDGLGEGDEPKETEAVGDGLAELEGETTVEPAAGEGAGVILALATPVSSTFCSAIMPLSSWIRRWQCMTTVWQGCETPTKRNAGRTHTRAAHRCQQSPQPGSG